MSSNQRNPLFQRDELSLNFACDLKGRWFLRRKEGREEMSLPSPRRWTYFSLRTPLKGSLSEVLTSRMRPVSLSRLAQLPLGVWNCERSRTAPLRLLSPVGGFLATGTSFYVRHRLVLSPATPGRRRPTNGSQPADGAKNASCGSVTPSISRSTSTGHEGAPHAQKKERTPREKSALPT